MILGLDIDGCLADFNTSYIALIEAETGKVLPVVSDNYPDVWSYPAAAGVTSAEEDRVWERIKATAFWRSLDPLPGARDVLKELAWSQHDVYFVTSRPGKTAKGQTEAWLEAHGYPNPTVLISSEKGPIAKGLSLHIFADDKLENCEDVLRDTDTTNVFLVDAPWNRSRTPDGAVRVKNVAEVLEIIR